MTATTVIQPIDMVKVRLQLKSEAGGQSMSPFKTAQEIIKNEGGVKGLYAGLDSALLRQAVYASARLGLYFNFTNYVQENINNGGPISFFQRAGCSLTAGALGSFIGNPCDLALVRMQADSTLPAEQRRNYKNVFDAFSRIVKEEGVTSCWKGSVPTMLRAMSLNTA